MRIGRQNRNDRGLSLLATVLALSLLLVAFTLAATSLVAGLRAARASREQILASQVLETEIERLRAKPFADLRNGSQALSLEGSGSRPLQAELPEAQGQVLIADYLPGVKQLTVQLQWHSRIGPWRTARLVTLRSQ